MTAADVASLLAQIAATEAVARAATPGPWHTFSGAVWGADEYGMAATSADKRDAAHIALNDPARVLARCAADREIVALHVSSPDPDQDGRDFCDGCDHAAPCPTLRALATAYAGPEGERHE